jgi:acyl-CoA thioester hydrolase
MSKIELAWELPQPFHIAVDVQESDIDEYNHTNNTVYLRWCDQAAWAHAQAAGAGRNDHIELRRGMAAYRTELHYIAPALLGDRVLVGDWIVAADARLRATRRFQMIRESDGVTLLRALIQYICIDLDSGRPARFPSSYRERYVVLPEVVGAMQETEWPFALPASSADNRSK